MRRYPSIWPLVVAAATVHGIHPREIWSRNKTRAVSTARREVCWIAHRSGLSTCAIAVQMHYRDLATGRMRTMSVSAVGDAIGACQDSLDVDRGEVGQRIRLIARTACDDRVMVFPVVALPDAPHPMDRGVAGADALDEFIHARLAQLKEAA